MLIASFPTEGSAVTIELSVGGISYSTQNERILMFMVSIHVAATLSVEEKSNF
jgi:hypothetical protein